MEYRVMVITQLKYNRTPPLFPSFLYMIFQIKTTTQWYRQVTTANASANYTAEFNMKEMSRGSDAVRFGAVFSYG